MKILKYSNEKYAKSKHGLCTKRKNNTKEPFIHDEMYIPTNNQINAVWPNSEMLFSDCLTDKHEVHGSTQLCPGRSEMDICLTVGRSRSQYILLPWWLLEIYKKP